MKDFRRGYVTIISIATATLLALVVGACSRSSSGVNDQQIVSSIDAKLYQDQDLKTLSINVSAKQGMVTLSGSVNAPLEKLAVEDLARKTDGVKQVADNLTVASGSQQASSTATPSQQAQQAQASPPDQQQSQASADDQGAPAGEEAQNGSQQPAQDSSGQVQDGAEPTSSGSTAPAPASPPAPATAPVAQAAPASPPPPPAPQQVTIPAGTEVSVRMIDSISSETAQLGEIYKASLSAPVIVNDQVVVPRGANARIRVVDVESAGHFRGQPLLKVELAGFTVNGTRYAVRSDYFHKSGSSRSKNSAEKVGGGAAVGALLGALIGHGKGAGIGAIVGGGAGAADQAATHAKEVRIASEARIDFTLRSPVIVTLNGGQ
jgi:hypothetical protein